MKSNVLAVAVALATLLMLPAICCADDPLPTRATKCGVDIQIPDEKIVWTKDCSNHNIIVTQTSEQVATGNMLNTPDATLTQTALMATRTVDGTDIYVDQDVKQSAITDEKNVLIKGKLSQSAIEFLKIAGSDNAAKQYIEQKSKNNDIQGELVQSAALLDEIKTSNNDAIQFAAQRAQNNDVKGGGGTKDVASMKQVIRDSAMINKPKVFLKQYDTQTANDNQLLNKDAALTQFVQKEAAVNQALSDLWTAADATDAMGKI